MATKDSYNMSDEVIDNKCSVCAGRNIKREAEKFCIECQDYYCIPCTDMHKAFPAMRAHKLLDKADFSTQALHSSVPCFPTESCPVHKGKLLDMFCKNHDEVVCATCVAISHRTCQDIHSIPDEVDILYKQSSSDQTLNLLDEEKEAAQDEKQVKQKLLSELKKQKEKATGSILDYRQEVEAELKKLESESIKQVDAEYAKKEGDLQDEIKETEKYIDDLEQSANKLQKSNGNKAQEFVCIKTAQKKIAAKFSTRSIKEQINVKITFSPETKIKSYLAQLKEIGKVSTAKTYKPRTTAYTVKQQRDINVNLKEDTNTWIFGSCFAEDGLLMLADLHNNKLKRLDITAGALQDHLVLEAGPIAVCLTSKQEAAVSLNNSTIQFVSLGDMMTTTKKLKLDYYCCGLAYKDGTLFVSDEGRTVYIHDINGTMLHKITTNKSGNAIFENNMHVNPSINSDFVYVADLRKGLITIDIQGNYLSAFTDPNLVEPYGVCTDGRGTIFVCGFSSSNIIQISENSNSKLGMIKTQANPSSVCFDPHQNILVVAYRGRTIKVYELQ